MAVHSGNKHAVAIRAGRVLPRNRVLGPRGKGIIYDLLGPDVEIRAVSILADSALSIASSLNVDADTSLGISGVFEQTCDFCCVITRDLQIEDDVSILVNGQLTLELPTSQRVYAAVAAGCDTALLVAGDVQLYTDVRMYVSGLRLLETDSSLIVQIARVVIADALLEITDAGLANADAVLSVVHPVDFSTDVRVYVLQRLAPDIDCEQIVYGLLICESHPIQS